MEKNCISLASDKTEAVILNWKRNRADVVFKLEDTEIRAAKELCYLGVTSGESLHFEKYSVKKTESWVTALGQLMLNMRGPSHQKDAAERWGEIRFYLTKDIAKYHYHMSLGLLPIYYRPPCINRLRRVKRILKSLINTTKSAQSKRTNIRVIMSWNLSVVVVNSVLCTYLLFYLMTTN